MLDIYVESMILYNLICPYVSKSQKITILRFLGDSKQSCFLIGWGGGGGGKWRFFTSNKIALLAKILSHMSYLGLSMVCPRKGSL